MAIYESEDRLRQKRTRTEQAIGLATKGRWDEAVRVNQELIELFPSDVDAHNRLGKALMELGRYAEARDAYAQGVKLEPANSIANKNLQRLSKLVEEGTAAPAASAVDPRLFIEESGKTTVTQLTDLRRGDAVSEVAAGDQLQLGVRGGQIAVLDMQGRDVGRIEPKLEQNLVRLLGMGNQYSVFATAAADGAINVIIRETHRSAQMGNRPSFRPSAAADTFRSYTREGVLRFDVDEEEEEEFAEEEEEEAEREAPPADAEAVEEAPLEALAAAEDEAEETT